MLCSVRFSGTPYVKRNLEKGDKKKKLLCMTDQAFVFVLQKKNKHNLATRDTIFKKAQFLNVETAGRPG